MEKILSSVESFVTTALLSDRKQWLTFGVLSSAILIVMFVLLLV